LISITRKKVLGHTQIVPGHPDEANDSRDSLYSDRKSSLGRI
jgi:hypothetical protein